MVDVAARRGGVEGAAENEIGDPLLGGPADGLGAEDAGRPDRRMRLLQRQLPRIDDAQMVVLALPAERAGHGPGLLDEVEGFLESLAVIGGIGVGRELLDAGAAHEARDDATARDEIEHRDLLGHAHRIVVDRQRIADEGDLALDALADHRRRDIDALLHRENVVVVLVADRAVEAHLGGVLVLAQEHLPEVARRLPVEDAVREHERGEAVFLGGFDGIGVVAHLGEEEEFARHRPSPVARIRWRL